MADHQNWKEFIGRIITGSGLFEKSTTESSGEVEIQTFKSTDKNSQTEIRVGYLKDNLLIFLHIFNPTVPGYNKYVEGEYFYRYQFSEPADYGGPALEFNEQNRDGIMSVLKKGLNGKEIQFIRNNKILRSDLYIQDFSLDFRYSYDFIDRSLLNRIFGKKVEKMKGVQRSEIELRTIFNGIKL